MKREEFFLGVFAYLLFIVFLPLFVDFVRHNCPALIKAGKLEERLFRNVEKDVRLTRIASRVGRP